MRTFSTKSKWLMKFVRETIECKSFAKTSIRTKSKSTISCWGLRNHGKVYLRQLSVDLVAYLLHHRQHHHCLGNSRLCQKTKRISCRIRSVLDSCNKRPRTRLLIKFYCKLVVWLLDPKEKNWSRVIRSRRP